LRHAFGLKKGFGMMYHALLSTLYYERRLWNKRESFGHFLNDSARASCEKLVFERRFEA
jgi:hypothetical protein